jgi:hypothetical protein
MDRATFDQAGRSLVEEEDRKRMEEQGDSDANPAVCLCLFLNTEMYSRALANTA